MYMHMSLNINEHWYSCAKSAVCMGNYKKNTVLKGSEKQKYFQAETCFQHDKQNGFIRSPENVEIFLSPSELCSSYNYK